MKHKFYILGFLIALLTMIVLASTTVIAATKTWVPTTGGAWTTAANWNPNGAPAAGDDIIIPADQSANITAIPAITLNSLTINGNCTLAAAANGNTLTISTTFTVASGKTLTLSGALGSRITFAFAATATGTINGTVAGGNATYTITNNGILIMAPAGILGGACNFTIAAGATLQIGSAAGVTTAGATGNIQVTGTRTYTTGASYVYNGTAAQVTGNGLTQNTPANLTINNSAGVTLSAATTISGLLTMTSGTLDMANTNLTVGSLTGSGNITNSSGAAGARTLTVGSDNTSPGAYSGIISNGTATAVAVTKTGSGTLILSGNNTYTGLTTIGAGILQLGAAGDGTNTPLGTTGSGTTVNSGATLDLNGFTLSTAEALSIAGTGASVGALTNSSATGVNYSGLITLTAASTIATNAGNINIINAGTITGATFALTLGGTGNGSITSIIGTTSGTVTKSGTGTWTLSGSNTYTGLTTISAGTLKLGSTGALGTGAGATTVTSGAVLDLNGITLSTAEPLTLNGTGLTASPAGALTNTGGNASYTGTITLGSASAITSTTSGTLTVAAVTNVTYALTLDGAGTGTVSGVIGASTGTVTKNGAGTWTLSGMNTYSGATTINAGTLQAGSTQAFGVASAVTLANTAGAILNITGYNNTIGSLTGGGTTGGNVTLGAATLTIGSDNTSPAAYAGVISGTGAVTKSGTGTLTLSGTNTFSGAVTISAGTLSVNTLANAGTSSSLGTGSTTAVISIGATGILQYTGTGHSTSRAIVLTGSGGTIDASGSGPLTLSGGVTGNTLGLNLIGTGSGTESGAIATTTGTVTKNGTGTWTLSGASTYTGATTISAGTLKLGNAAALGTGAGAATVSSGAVLDLNGITLSTAEPLTLNGTGLTASPAGALTNTGSNASYSGAITLGAIGATITSTASGTLTLSGGIGGATFALTLDGAGTGTISGIIGTTSGTLTKNGIGTWTLSGANTFTGLVTINAGTIQCGVNNALSTNNVTVNDGATYNLNGFSDTIGALTVNSGVTGGTVTTGAGTLTLGGNVTSTGGAANASISGNLALGANRTFTVTNAADGLIVSAVVSGAFTLTKAGNGASLLSGANTYTGVTTINGGTLQLGNASALGTTASGTTIAAGAVLDLNGINYSNAEALTVNGTGISNGGAIINSSSTSATYAGLITLGSASSIVGGTGTIAISNAGTITGATFGLTLGGAAGGSIASIIGTTSGTVTVNAAGGTWTLSGANTFSGAVTISAGTLSVNTLANAGTSSSLGTGSTTAAISIGATGILQYTGTGHSTSRAVVLTGSGGTIDASGSGTLTLSGGVTGNTYGLNLIGTGSGTESGVIATTTGTVTKNGTGTWTLSGTNTYTGLTAINGGTLKLGNTAALGTGATGNTVGSGAVLDLNGFTLSTAEPLTLNGTGLASSPAGALTNTGAAASYTGTITLGSASTITSTTSGTLTVAAIINGTYALTLDGAGTGTVSGVIGASTGAVTKNGTGTWTLSSANTFTGGTTLNAGTLRIGNASALGTAAGTFTINGGTIDVTGAITAVNYPQTWTGNFTFTGSNTLNLGTGTVTMSASCQVTVTASTLTIGGAISGSTYNLTKAGSGTMVFGINNVSLTNLTVSAGALTSTSGTLNLAGNFSNGGTFTSNSGTVAFNGSSAQTIGGTSASTFYNLTINNASGVSLTAAVSVAGTLTLTSGILTTSATSLLTITNTTVGSITGASATSYVNGPLAMTLLANVAADGMTYSFPVGETGNYRPLDLVNIRTGATAPVVRVTISGTGASTGDGTTITSIAPRNWYVQTTSGNFTSATVRLTESGLIPTNVIGKSNAQSGNYVSIGGLNIGTSVTSAQTVSSFPVYFAIGISAIKPLYSYQSGNWDSTTTWTTDPSGTLWLNPRVPGTADNAVILNGRTISITTNNKTVTTLTINSGGILNINSTTGHNFGTVTGQGKLILSSNSFPSGTFTKFVASNGGTVEFYNLNNVPISTTQFTYNNLIISDSSGTISTYLNNGSNPTTYTINGNFSLKNYSSGSQTFYFGNPTASDNLINMTVYGNFSVDAGCNIRVNNFATSHAIPNPSDEGATAYPVHSLSLYGSLTNNGSVRFTGLPSPLNTAYYTLTTTATGGINYGDIQVFFYGATNNTMICNGTTDFFRLIVAKGSDNTYTLEVSSSNTSNFALYAPNYQGNDAFNGGTVNGYGYGAYYKALFIHYGTLKLDANISIPSLTEGGQDFNVIPTAGLWINGANVSTTVTGLNGTGYQAATLYGSLRISAGQFSTGDAAGIVLGTLGTPMIMIEGTGVLDVSQAWTASGGSNLMSYVQTGGTANIRLQGENHAGPMLGLSSPNASFVMSGGTLNFNYNTFVDATTDYAIMDVESQTGYYQVTGGTVNLNLPSSATTYTANSTVPFYNLNILNKTGSGTTTIQWNTPGSSLSVLSNLTIGSNAVLNLNTSSISLFVGGNFTISSGGTYTPGTADTTTFNGSGYQAFTNAGTITGGLTSLTVTNFSSTTIITNNVTVNGTLTIGQNAVLNDSGKYVYANGNVVNAGTHAGLPTGGGIRMTGTTAQTINGNGKFYNLIIDKSNTTGVSLLNNMMVTGSLRLVTNPNLTIGSYNLTLDSTANVYTDLATSQNYDSLHMIVTTGLASDNGITKKFSSANTTFLYPIGTGTKYRPAQVQFTTNPTQYGSVTIRPVASVDPLVQTAGKAITFYWKVTSSNFSGIQNNSINQVYYYKATDAPTSTDEKNYIPAVYIAPSWSSINDTSLVLDYKTPREIHFNSINYLDGEYTCGTAAAFGIIPTYYSNSNNSSVTSSTGADWNAAGTWCTGSNTGTPAGALADNMSNAIFIIGDGSSTTHTITIGSSHHILTGNVFIQADAVLDLGTSTGHNFGSIQSTKVTGNGKLRIASSAYFPTGDWGAFLGTSGGSVEYYETVASSSVQMPSTYSLPASGTANITGYYNLTMLPYYNSTITFPNTSLTVYHNLTVGYTSGGGTTSCVTQLNNGLASTTLEVRGALSINQYGTLQYMNTAAQYVLADSDLTIAAGGALQVRNAGTSVANTLTAIGNVINNGTLDLDPNYPTNDNYNCTLVFSGSSSKALTNTTTKPTRTRLYGITVNKGATIDSVVNISIDTTGFQMGNGGLSLQNGTFRLTSTVTMALSSGGFTIPVTGGLSANGGTFNIVTGAASADLTLKGRLEVLSGTVNVGPAISSASAISSGIVYSAAGSPTITISGGTLNVFSQIRRDTANNSGSLNYTQMGGTVTVGARNPYLKRAAFEDLNTGSSFVMSNGTLIIAGGSINTVPPYDLDLEPDNSKVTGGTIQFGLSGVTTNQTAFLFQTSIPLWNLTLDATTNAAAAQEVFNSTISGNLTIGGASSYYNANGLDLEIGGNLINNNTDASTGLNVGGFQAQSLTQTTSFLGSSDQTITGTSSNRTNFANLEIAASSTHTVFLSSGTCSFVVNGDLTLTSGTLNDGGNSIYLLNDVDNNAVHVSPNANTGGMIFSGTSNQGMTGSGSGIFGNIEINNSGNGVNMTDNSTINGQIKFTKGYLYIDDYALTLGLSAAVAGTPNASNLILLNGVLSDKGVTKIFGTGASTFTLPIGANGKYTPASFNFSSNNNTGATIKVIPVDGLHPSVNPDSVSDYLDYYWYVSTTGFSSSYNVTHTYTYITADTVGTPAHIERYDNTTSKWSTVAGSITPPTFSFTSGSLLDGSYTIGDVFISLPTLFSIMSGSWYNGSLWSTDTTTKVPYGKIPKGNPVFIRAQDSVALSANNANATSVVIYGVLDAENTTFHDIGQVSGSGKIRMSSTSNGFFAFPGGTYDAFFSNPASTVEFYGSINGRLPLDPGNTTKPYQNVIFSGTSIKYISSVDTKINGNLTINNGSKLDNTQYNKNVYVLGNWTDNNTSTVGFAPGNGTVYFSGSAGAQRIVMGTGSMTETFYNFAINNASGVTISTGNAAVSSQLILASGNITTSSSDTLTITNTDTGAVVGGGVNSFVNGPLRKQIMSGSNFQFPVGDAVSSNRNRFGYVSVRSTSTSGTQTWTAQFIDKNPTTDGYNISNLTSPLKSVVYNEYWKISGPTGGTANVTLSWDQYTVMSSSLSIRALSMVAEWGTPVASSWNSVGNVVSDFGQDSGTVATSTLLNLGGTQIFTIGSSTAAIAALITSIQTGVWNNPSVWNVGRVPSPIDTVVITSPYSVALNTASTISRFAVNSGGTYNDSTFTLTVTGNVTLNGTWVGSGKLSLITSADTLYGTGTATGKSTLEIAGGIKIIASSANLILKIVSILSGDTLNNYGSVTIDSLTGAAAGSVFNNLPGATLTINGSMLATGTLNAGTSPNTVIYDGSVSQAIKPTTYCNVTISGAGPKFINNGSTTINNGSLELSAGPVLTIESGASVTTTGTGKIILDANASYINLSSSAPKLQVLTRITGLDGWRMLSAPDTVTVSSMFGGKFVTQGFTGSTYPALQPNLLWWDETSQGTSLQAWRQPSYSTDTVKLGRGYMFYVFNGTKITGQSGNYSDTLPLTMSALGAEHPLTAAFDFGVTATTRSPGGSSDTTRIDTNYADYGWNLVGNPTPSAINWNASSGWTKTHMDGTIYVWDPNDTTGGYKTWNGTTGNLGSGLIAPFQAFWVKANANSPSLKCDNGVKTTGGSFLGNIAKGPTGASFPKKMADDSPGGSSLKRTANDSASSTPVLSLALSANGLQAQAYLMLSDQGKLSYDPYDAFSLVPLSTNYLILYSVAGEGQPAMQIQDLPDIGFGDPFTLPLYVGGTVGGQPLNGSFTLDWKLDGQLPTGWNIMLMDDAARKAYTMAAGGELTFQYNTPADLVPSSSSFLEKNSGTASNRRSLPVLPWPVVQTVPTSKLSKTASVTPRFRLVISANNDLTGYLPSTPELAQNYPNPFNPSTNIAFSVPAPSRVTIEVFNVLGQKVATVTDQNYATGKYVVTWNPRSVASGVYFCRMIVGNHKQTIKMVLLR